jgi:tetratricopeptide (TPR) repeat protein
MQDEIVARLAGALNAELVAAEARRAEQAPNPDSMDLYFQGMAWFNKGLSPDNVTQARSFFDRALAADPDNVDALIGSARADSVEGAVLFSTDPIAAFAAAEAKLTKALSSVPDHARAHMFLGFVEMMTRRAAEGIAECEHALALDRNLASAHSFIGRGKIFVGRAEETEAPRRRGLAPQSARYDGQHLDDARGLCEKPAGRLGPSGGVVPAGDRGQSKSSDGMVSLGRRARAAGRLDEAHSAVKAGLALAPSFTVSRARANWTAPSDDSTYLAQLEPIFEGLRKAGLPEQ